MCIAIVKPAKMDITDERLSICFKNNPDGAGFCYYDEQGKLCIRKGYMKFQKFLKAYKKVCQDRRMLIHFRIKTVGDKTPENCHPWKIGCNSAMVHNGTITDIKAEDKLSDSGTLAKWLSAINAQSPGAFMNEAGYKMIEALAKPSRIAIMTPLKFEILNKDSWTFADGCWYSNQNFKYDKYEKDEKAPWRYNQTRPHDFTKEALRHDHYEGVAFRGATCSPASLYVFWNDLPQIVRTSLLEAQDHKKRPQGVSTCTTMMDLFKPSGEDFTCLSEEKFLVGRMIATRWIELYIECLPPTDEEPQAFLDKAKQQIARLSFYDQCMFIAMVGKQRLWKCVVDLYNAGEIGGLDNMLRLEWSDTLVDRAKAFIAGCNGVSIRRYDLSTNHAYITILAPDGHLTEKDDDDDVIPIVSRDPNEQSNEQPTALALVPSTNN